MERKRRASYCIQELSKVKLNKMTTMPFAKFQCTTDDQMAKNNTIYTCIIFICLLENYVHTMHAGLMISSVNKFNFICVCMHGWHMTHLYISPLFLFLLLLRFQLNNTYEQQQRIALTSSLNENERFVNQVFIQQQKKKLNVTPTSAMFDDIFILASDEEKKSINNKCPC